MLTEGGAGLAPPAASAGVPWRPPPFGAGPLGQEDGGAGRSWVCGLEGLHAAPAAWAPSVWPEGEPGEVTGPFLMRVRSHTVSLPPYSIGQSSPPSCKDRRYGPCLTTGRMLENLQPFL